MTNNFDTVEEAHKRKTIKSVWSQLYDITKKLERMIARINPPTDDLIFLLKQAIKVAQEALEELGRETKPNGGK